MVNLDELMCLHEAATPGPWHIEDYTVVCNAHGSAVADTYLESFAEKRREANAGYICASCNAVPELVSRIKHLEAQLYEAVGYIISNESMSMIDCRICFFEQYCERKKDQWKPDPEMCRKAIMHCITTEEREEHGSN